MEQTTKEWKKIWMREIFTNMDQEALAAHLQADLRRHHDFIAIHATPAKHGSHWHTMRTHGASACDA